MRCTTVELTGAFLVKNSLTICSACALVYTSSSSFIVNSTDGEKFLLISFEFADLNKVDNESTYPLK